MRNAPNVCGGGGGGENLGEGFVWEMKKYI